jgi:hypothetical protein
MHDHDNDSRRTATRGLLALVAVVALLGASGCALWGDDREPVSGREQLPRLMKIQDGWYTPTELSADELLELDRYEELRVLAFTEEPKNLSDVHLENVKQFVDRGGVVWIQGRFAEYEPFRIIAPITVSKYEFNKTGTGKRSGELIVRGKSPRLQIQDHVLTEGVERLYLYPRYKFDGTIDAEPLVEMTDSEGDHGTVLAAIPVGLGFVVLDGTAREKNWVFGRIEGFDPEHPNAIAQAGVWNSYDWDELRENAIEYADRML